MDPGRLDLQVLVVNKPNGKGFSADAALTSARDVAYSCTWTLD